MNRAAQIHRRVNLLLIRVNEFMLTERGAAAPAPRHDAVTAVEPSLLLTRFEEIPDMLDVVVVHREIRGGLSLLVIPMHPLPKADGLLRNTLGEFFHTGAASAGELVQTVVHDVLLRVEAQLLLNLDLQPQPLAVEAVLPPLVVTPWLCSGSRCPCRCVP